MMGKLPMLNKFKAQAHSPDVACVVRHSALLYQQLTEHDLELTNDVTNQCRQIAAGQQHWVCVRLVHTNAYLVVGRRQN